jgi:hypothetical protein
MAYVEPVNPLLPITKPSPGRRCPLFPLAAFKNLTKIIHGIFLAQTAAWETLIDSSTTPFHSYKNPWFDCSCLSLTSSFMSAPISGSAWPLFWLLVYQILCQAHGSPSITFLTL